MRFHAVIDEATGLVENVPYTAQEETARNVEEAAEATRRTADATVSGNAATLRTRLAQADAACKTYEAAANPSAAQTTAHVKLLSRIVRGLARLQLNQLDASD